ncbi:hypothetical protein LTS01_025153, partial [Friedmanniomyces endolithicus]
MPERRPVDIFVVAATQSAPGSVCADPERAREGSSAIGRRGGCRLAPQDREILPDFHAVPHLLTGERRVGFFKRIFTLPIEVEAGKVTAKLEAGLLSLRVPKHEAARGKGVIAI